MGNDTDSVVDLGEGDVADVLEEEGVPLDERVYQIYWPLSEYTETSTPRGVG